MNRIYTILAAAVLTAGLLAQPPQKMSYQFVVRNSSGNLMANQSVGVRVTVLQGSASGTVTYQEIFNPNPQTNANGLVSIEIGGGVPVTGTFSAINWTAGPYFLKTETDPSGGTTYSVSGTSQLLSVPYALNSSLASGLANNTVGSANIVNESIVASDIQDRLRNIVFPANALNYDKGSSVMSQSYLGIIWTSDYNGAAYITIPKPLDWDETNNVTLKLFFVPTTNAGGVVVFFIRPRSYNSGETFADATTINPVSNVTIPVSSQGKVYEQSFTIPPARFGTKSMWLVSIQREGTGETYSDSLHLLCVELIYTAVQ
jgi:hypothetical protein